MWIICANPYVIQTAAAYDFNQTSTTYIALGHIVGIQNK